MQATAADRFRSITPEAGIALVLGLLTLAFWNLPVSHDVVWQLWIARQLLHGAELYAEIIEVNPPLWFWAAVPVQGLAEMTGLTARSLLVTTTLGLIGLALFLLARLFAEEKPRQRAGVLVAALLGLTLVPIHEFAQREHVALIGAIPYAMLAARRAEGKAVPFWVAALTGLLAAYGFALKHYFLLIPIALEGWLVLCHRANWRALRPETLVLAVCGLVYGVAVFWLTPAFFDSLVPMVAAAYDGYKRPLAILLARPWAMLWMLGLVGLAAVQKPLRPAVTAGLLTSLSFAFAYFIQQKGWLYHAVSASGAMTFTLGLAIFLQPLSWRWMARRPSLPAAFLLLLALAVWQGPYVNPLARPIRTLLADVKPGEPVAILSIHATQAWPTLEQAGYVWPLRLYSYWMLPAIANTPEAEKSAALRTVENQTIRYTRDDLWCIPPAAIIVDDSSTSPYMNRRFDMIGFFSRDAALKALLAHYEPARTLGPFMLLKLVDPLQPINHGACRKVY